MNSIKYKNAAWELKRIAKYLTAGELSVVKDLKFRNMKFDREKYGAYSWKDIKGSAAHNYDHEVIVMIGEENGKVIVEVFDASLMSSQKRKFIFFKDVDDLMKNKNKVINYVEKRYNEIWSK